MKLYINIFLGVGLALGLNSSAQENHLAVINYQVDNERFFEVTGFAAGSDIAFYSNISGGDVLRALTTPHAGRYVFTAGRNFQPAFVLNIKDENKNNIKGTGMVSFLKEDEFLLQNLSVNILHNNMELSWQAKVNAEGEYYFEVLKSRDGGEYTVAQVILAGATLSTYSFADFGNEVNASYKVRLIKNGLPRYTSSALRASISKQVELYPSPANGYINVVTNASVENLQYLVINGLGQVQLRGNFDGFKSRLNIEGLSPGVYFLQLEDTKEVMSRKRFVKL